MGALGTSSASESSSSLQRWVGGHVHITVVTGFNPVLVPGWTGRNKERLSHWNSGLCSITFWLDSKSVAEADSELDFFFKKSSLRLAFLLRVDGLFFFLEGRGVFFPSLESREKVKVEPMVRENLKALPWPASAWHNSKHLLTKGKSLSFTAAIFLLTSELWNLCL